MTMKIPTRREVEQIKARYAKGMRIELLHMDDPYSPPAGTLGTIITVDDLGDLVIAWDNGSGLNVVPWVDRVRIITEGQEKSDVEGRGHRDS